MQADMVSITNQFPKAFDQSIKPLLAHFGIDAPDIMISDLVLDSRDVAIHKAFIAIKGHSLDGRDFIPQAVSLGAKVIVAQCDDKTEHGHVEMREQSVIVYFYQLPEKLSELAGYFYQFPANSMSVIAVTGTNGKTSTVQLSSQLAVLMGEQAAVIGTLGAAMYHTNSDSQPSHDAVNTTPDAISMQRLLSEFVSDGAYQVALEASSHALVQNRIQAVKTDIAVFTNLSRDHLDYHGSMAEYAKAKRLLLCQPELAFAVLNANDPEHKNWLLNIPKSTSVVLFGLNVCVADLPNEHKFCVANNVRYTADGIALTLQSSWGDAELRLALLGEFNVANVLAAISSQLCLGKSLKQIAYIVQKLKPVAGRMELYRRKNHATVVVDYAHTPDALEKALLATRQHCHGKLLCVFGCGGDRDVGKRSLMGEIAERLADQVILTDDNVRSENPQSIIQDILAGCINPEQMLVEHDRKSAIKTAAAIATAGDMILVAGKGHESYQIIGNQRLAYDERQFVALLQEGKTS
ncbi:UDP-N-acetylmuramoyl-L-alanyl-D-glutamate--2,6-diaminopimelate ligase [uncultured Paraglaciecola sp.]|uniref:UDP-N-acetylmuramoyl-L-alanyl-D-glutamate--2, 6-diaminopimelate ligase n=1 Tax=uncultured Paraglaciecola sp. TaxID=1765024 RepID=UPI002611EF9A|nr:UDP-N-acetylmuramoyl-L-alanyl-D-glutamate--2,6-diaminopimelate ligase [uncultured Paraglaciecola sp.]